MALKKCIKELKEKNYEKFLSRSKKIRLIGINIFTKTKDVEDYLIEGLITE